MMDDLAGRKDLKTLLESYERTLILAALAAHGGHQRRAASALGVLPSTLCEKMKRLGIRSRPGDGPSDQPPSSWQQEPASPE